MVFAVESLEHVIFTNASLVELGRVLRPGGVIAIIDKTVDDPLRRHELWKLEKWERWFGSQEMEYLLKEHSGVLPSSTKAIPISGIDDGVFVAWFGHKEEYRAA